MAVKFVPGEDDEAAILVCIGNVCLQWSLLEINLMAILQACQGVDLKEGAILFGGLDMKPRLNMAINLAVHHKWPPPLIKRLRNLRSAIDKAKLSDRRNMVVHGAQSRSEVPTKTINLYSPRRSGDAQREDWSVQDAHLLGSEINAAAREAWDIFESYGRWKFGDNRLVDQSGEIVAAPIGRFTRFKQYLSARLNRFRRQVT